MSGLPIAAIALTALGACASVKVAAPGYHILNK
jgi:hypothetical protein